MRFGVALACLQTSLLFSLFHTEIGDAKRRLEFNKMGNFGKASSQTLQSRFLEVGRPAGFWFGLQQAPM